MIIKKKLAGPTSGTVMCRNRCRPPAPSVRAASYRSVGTPWSAARYMIMLNPTRIHSVMSTTDAKAPGRWTAGAPGLAEGGEDLVDDADVSL